MWLSGISGHDTSDMISKWVSIIKSPWFRTVTSERIMRLSGILGHDTGDLISKWSSTIKSPLFHTTISVNIMWLCGISGHSVDGLISKWKSTIKPLWGDTVTSRSLPVQIWPQMLQGLQNSNIQPNQSGSEISNCNLVGCFLCSN